MEENNFSNQATSQGQNAEQPLNNPFYQAPVPYSTGVLVLGILSIVGCFCYLIPGLIMGIIAIVLAKTGTHMYNANPNLYSTASFNNLKAGKVCGIIGVILTSVAFIFIGIYVLIVGVAGLAAFNSGAFGH
jgi:uncharacterized membrane protein YjjP (DUF1212 family)